MGFPVSKSNLKQLRKPRSQKGLKAIKPQLTSLIDVMTILLIYLLKSFSSEGEIVTLSKQLMLPESTALKKPKLTVVLTVNNHYILAEDKAIANIKRILASDELVIPELASWLQTRRSLTQNNDQYSDTKQFKGDITIQADKHIRFRLLKKIMYTCGQQEYNNFSLAVLKKEG